MWDNTTFELIDPRELLLDKNARTIVDIESEAPDLVASVKLHGVMVPLIANPAENGRRRVREGHSRALAAILAVDEHPVVPVLVTACTDDRVWIRLRDQWVSMRCAVGSIRRTRLGSSSRWPWKGSARRRSPLN